MKVTKHDLAVQLAKRTDITKSKADEYVDELLDILRGHLENGDTIELRKFGVFKTEQRAARQARNPRTGEPVAIPPRTVIKFKASAAISTN